MTEQESNKWARINQLTDLDGWKDLMLKFEEREREFYEQAVFMDDGGKREKARESYLAIKYFREYLLDRIEQYKREAVEKNKQVATKRGEPEILPATAGLDEAGL